MTGDEASERNSHPEAPHQSMAVLFADITDSTKLYNTLGDAAARVVINGCLLAVADVAERYRGRVVKTIGDEALCIFRRADDAVLAASAMQPEVEARRPGNCAIQLHIGLQYGPVLLEEHDVYGDTVNVAAYLTALAAAEQILTTDATERYVSGPLKDTNVFPSMVVQMINVGETTGALDAMLSKIADFYEDEVDSAVAGMLTLLEPVMIAFLGVVVGGIVIAMYLPIFDLISKLSN